MNEDIYAPPKSKLLDKEKTDNELAGRWQRLGASLLDGIIMMLVTLPVMYFTGGFDVFKTGVQPSLIYNLLMAVLGLVAFILLNGKLLVDNGQTIGKKVLGIKIVDINGNKATVNDHLLKRYAVYFIPGQIPFAGGLISLINILFIFGKTKRCIHDHVASTIVVKC